QSPELTTVRVQDPRVQNEGSWNSYVDYKIFLHTNSKAFTAKTSCVRRRYREFVWLRRQLQKNAGLVPVPELPGKSTFFVGSTDEFIEKRRQGLQQFLEKVVQNVVLLSDSRLHLFLQTPLLCLDLLCAGWSRPGYWQCWEAAGDLLSALPPCQCLQLCV
uniref:Sorting nexin 11 n=1 Tax=Buteo japonicus TaxID=224669 RepID=A0A8C0B9K1_9AVES